MRWFPLGLLAVFATSMAACGGPSVPLQAQAGASVVIPLTGDLTSDMPVIGFGSDLVEDPQRGELVYRLRGTETELLTRATSSIQVGFPSNLIGGDVQIVSLVDIPPESPVGTFAIDVVRRYRDAAGIVQEIPVPYGGVLSVLPHELDFDCDATVDSVGAPTPWSRITGAGSSFNILGFAQLLLEQHPQLILRLDSPVSALELDLDYPPGVIAIEDVTASPGRKTEQKISWWEETAPGRASVAVLGRGDFQEVAVAFSLVDGGSQVLDPASVNVTIRSTTDDEGNEVARVLASRSIR